MRTGRTRPDMAPDAGDDAAWIERLRAIAAADAVAAHQRCGSPTPAPLPSRRDFLMPPAPIVNRLRGFLINDPD